MIYRTAPFCNTCMKYLEAEMVTIYEDGTDHHINCNGSISYQVISHKPASKLIPNYYSETTCDDCGEDIEECYWTNEQGQSVHVTTSTNGHYYDEGGARCDGCHESSR